MGTGFALFWEGMTEEQEEQLPVASPESLQFAFCDTTNHDGIVETYGEDVAKLGDLYNFEPDKNTAETGRGYMWMEAPKLLDVTRKLRAGAERHDPVLDPLACRYDYNNDKGAEDYAWDRFVEALYWLEMAVEKAVALGAGPVTFDGSGNFGPWVPRRK